MNPTTEDSTTGKGTDDLLARTDACAPSNDASCVESPIFLAGVLRSGTTLLRLMLDNHPSVCWPGEFDYAVDQISPDGRLPEMEQFVSWLKRHRIFQDQGWTIDETLSYTALLTDVLSQARNASGASFVGATFHRHYLRALKLWPHARFIHLTRDPRDVARSWMTMGWAGSMLPGARGWLAAEQEWDRLVDVLPPEARISVRYEDLIQDPEGTLSQLCEFIGVPFDESMLRYDERSTYKRPDPSLVNQWQQKLPPRDVQLIESVCCEMMRSRGYEPTSPELRPITPMQEWRCWLADSVYKTRFRCRRYGMWLYLQDIVSKRVGTGQWRQRTVARMDQVTRDYLK